MEYVRNNYHSPELYKCLGKEVGDALRNKDEYIREKERFKCMIADVEKQICDGLGREVHWPTWQLRDLVQEIKAKSEGLR